jgi:1,4-dihydroxy-6-naphthoate synthase
MLPASFVTTAGRASPVQGEAGTLGVHLAMKMRLGHSPDSDDAFMFWGLATGRIQTYLEFEHILRDIQTLNEWALEGRLECTAVSVHALAHVAGRYALLRYGGSFGDGYGPMLISRNAMPPEALRDATIAVPGTMTTAFLALSLYFAEAFGDGAKPRHQVVPFAEILPAVRDGRFEAGLLIHEGQLTYASEGLAQIEDLGRWWKSETGLPLPLGVNVVRKDLGSVVAGETARCIRESILASLDNREEALRYALQFARGMDAGTSDQFVGMYVNERTLDMGDEGLAAIRLLLERGADLGLVPATEVVAVG